MTTTVRALTAADADIVQEMVLEFGAYLTRLGDAWRHNFTEDRYLTDGFGPQPGLSRFHRRRMPTASSAIS